MKIPYKMNVLGAVFVFLVSLVVLSAPKVGAVTCSGTSCNGKDPIYTGCNQNAYLAKSYIMKDTYGIAIWDKVEVYYSRSCGTNWLRITGNPYGGQAYKRIESLNANGTPRYTEIETDPGYGSSYSMMVYAPGSTKISFYGKVFDTAGRAKAWSDVATLQ